MKQYKCIIRYVGNGSVGGNVLSESKTLDIAEYSPSAGAESAVGMFERQESDYPIASGELVAYVDVSDEDDFCGRYEVRGDPSPRYQSSRIPVLGGG